MIKKNFSDSRGVTFLEMIIVISIFAILSSVVLLRFSVFSSSVSIENLAQDVALKIQQAQNASINGAYPKLAVVADCPPGGAVGGGVGGANAGGGCVLATLPPDLGKWVPSYGVYFDIGTQGHSRDFIYFFDRNNNGVFDDVADGSFDWGFKCGQGTSECLEVVHLSNGEQIASLMKGSNGGGVPVRIANSDLSHGSASIVFKRPFPDSHITDDTGIALDQGDDNGDGIPDGTIISPTPDMPDYIIINIEGVGTVPPKTSIYVGPLGRITVGENDH